jgi:hypothetical protein
MAIYKANYVKRGEGEKKRAKATIRYIEYRRGKDGERIRRTLYDTDGPMTRQEAYWMIDAAEEGSYFYRSIISPDPNSEDAEKDLDMRDIAERTMLKVNERFNRPILWVAATHADHKPHRHIHVLAVVPGKLNVKDFETLRAEATAACLQQRLELDYALQLQQQEREQQAWQEWHEAAWDLSL